MVAGVYCVEQQPESTWDWALLVAALVASLPYLGANAVLATRMRRRRYVIAQGGAPLILLSSACGLLWIVASFVTNLHFPRDTAPLQKCALWTFWLHLALGFWLWLVCLILRLYRLYLLVKLPPDTAASISSRSWIVQLLLLWLPALIFASIGTGYHASRMENGVPNCKISSYAWRLSTYLIPSPIYFLLLVVLLFRLKNCKDYMLATEYTHTSEYAFMAFVLYLLYGVTVVTESQCWIAGRCFVTFCVCCLVFIHFWVRMGWPVYLCLFKGDSELDSFEEELRCCGAECFDKIPSLLGSSRSLGRVPFPAHDGDWILRATNDAMLELSECKDKIRELEAKKITLSTKRKEFQMLINPAPVSPTIKTVSVFKMEEENIVLHMEMHSLKPRVFVRDIWWLYCHLVFFLQRGALLLQLVKDVLQLCKQYLTFYDAALQLAVFWIDCLHVFERDFLL